ncbi:pyridoxal phosphate-dependent aminotransferase [Thiorhodococcus fuscus]|uniref:Aminotransferase n=1 Tax=Thiorhodococcus fuscus TaxID=527200 RepID=A0ABW4YCN7_9GAMM
MPESHPNAPRDYLNLNIRGMGPSATLAINARSAALAAEGRKIYRMGLGQSPFPVPDPVVAALRENAHQKAYLPVRGLPELHRAIGGYLKRTQGIEYPESHILVGPGTKELMFIVQLTYYGELVIPNPSWVSYAPQARIIGRHLQWLPTRPETGHGVTPAVLDAHCRLDPDRPRLLILNYPGNPSGTAYEADQLAEIAEVARRYRVLVLSDEIYGGLRFDGAHVSIARFYPEGTIISDGLSKWCGAGGWRVGALAFPEELDWLAKAMAVVASETFTSTSAPIQYAAVRGFSPDPEIDRYLDRSRRILAALSGFAFRTLTACGADVCEPKGAFYLFPDFGNLSETLNRRGVHSGAELCERLLEDTGVATLPGDVFGRAANEFFMRLATVDFDGAAALAALDDERPVDETFLRDHCGSVVTALERIADWMAG